MTTYRVGPKGQVVVPKAIRDQIGLEPGHEVHVELVGAEIRIRRARPLTFEEFRGIWGPPDWMAGWAAEKHREIELEERKWRTWAPSSSTPGRSSPGLPTSRPLIASPPR